MRSKDGLIALVVQSRTSILGQPILMKELISSCIELNCLEDIIWHVARYEKKSIVNALRTVMLWYGVEIPDVLPLNTKGVDALCELIYMASLAA